MPNQYVDKTIALKTELTERYFVVALRTTPRKEKEKEEKKKKNDDDEECETETRRVSNCSRFTVLVMFTRHQRVLQ